MSKEVIVTGLPRSGTSVTAGVVYHLGVEWDELYCDTKAAPPQHPTPTYDDREFANMNEGIRPKFRLDDWVNPEDYIPKWREMIARKKKGKKMWGMKDPRVSFMLSTFEQACTDAKFILTMRDREDHLEGIKRYYMASGGGNDYWLDSTRKVYFTEINKLQSPHFIIWLNELKKDPIYWSKQIADFLAIGWSKEKEDAINNLVIC
jgi:hypothetical protein